MKKALVILSSALFVAAMAVSCGNKNAEEVVEDSVIDETEEVVEEAAPEAVEATVEATTTNATVDAAMLAAAKEAGQAKCNCYKKDPASVENCIRALLTSTYAAYKDNAEFKKAMDAEYQNCIKAKATEAVKTAGDKAISDGAKAISKKLNGGK